VAKPPQARHRRRLGWVHYRRYRGGGNSVRQGELNRRSASVARCRTPV